MPATRPLADRFWEKVNKDGPVIRPELGPCWVWTAGTNSGGYGLATVRHGMKRGAHRVAWFLATGEWSPLDICHHCDNEPCVRKEHLFEGTAKDNMADRDAKGRRPPPIGRLNGRARLTEHAVQHIRASDQARDYLAGLYGVTVHTISAVRARKIWKHV